jgi:REP element-mobilizing transposase RayT
MLRSGSPKRGPPHTGARQLALPLLTTWGGKRRGAGRKPFPGRSPTPHRALADHKARDPVHVTLRALFRPLRSQHVFPTVRIAMARANRRDPERFRIVHFSVQSDHIHLIVEASNKRALSSGVRSLVIRVARYVNELVNRKGRFWADRWFGRDLTTPRQVRNALVYVLANFRKHARRSVPPGIDAFSSGAWFDGFREWRPRSFDGATSGRAPPWSEGAPPPFPRTVDRAGDDRWVVVPARTWLTCIGWRRHGLVGLGEAPPSLSPSAPP